MEHRVCAVWESPTSFFLGSLFVFFFLIWVLLWNRWWLHLEECAKRTFLCKAVASREAGALCWDPKLLRQKKISKIHHRNTSGTIFPIEGSINQGELIFFENTEIGKILIDKDYPFAIIKFTDKKFPFKSNFKLNNATIKIIKPDWINFGWQMYNKPENSPHYLIISNIS